MGWGTQPGKDWSIHHHRCDDRVVVARQLDALAEDPDLAKAVYDVVDARLSLERQGVVPVPDSIPVGATAVPTDSAAPGTAADRTVPPP